MTESDLLMRMIALIAGTASVAWIAVAVMMRIAPLASSRFGLANLMLLLSIPLALKRDTSDSYLFWQCADLFALYGFLTMRSGLRQLFKLPMQHVLQSSFYAVLTVSYFSFAPDSSSTPVFGALYSIATATIMLFAFLDVYVPAKKEFNLAASVAISAPFAFATLLMLWRAVLFSFMPPQLSSSSETEMLWFFCALTLILNIVLFACVLSRLVAKIRSYSERDHLTGLLNRRAFERRFNEETQRFLRSNSPFAILLFDMDYFKQINDREGHACGDAALVHAAEVTKRCLRAVDVAARHGGEEFIVLLPDSDLEQANIVAERLRKSLAESTFKFGTKSLTLTASFGGVVSHQVSVEDILKHADKALYRAKHLGRNCVVMHSALSEVSAKVVSLRP